jgi:hypothetical protein
MSSRLLAPFLAVAAMAAAVAASAATVPPQCPSGFSPSDGGLCVKVTHPSTCEFGRTSAGLCVTRNWLVPVCPNTHQAILLGQKNGGPYYTCRFKSKWTMNTPIPMTNIGTCPPLTTARAYVISPNHMNDWTQCRVDGTRLPTCVSGTYDRASRKCRTTSSRICPPGYQYDARRSICTDGAIAQ